MIEFIIGLLCLGGGLVLIFGGVTGVLPLGGLDFIAGLLIATFGTVMMSHGLYRYVRDRREGEPHGLRTRALMLVTVLIVTLIVVFGAGFFGQMTISGLAVGYHAMAEAVPIALFLLYLTFKRKQAALDRDGVRASLNEQGTARDT